MATIGRLNNDIVYQVFNLLDADEGRSDLLNASKVCQAWHSTAQTIIDGTVSLILAPAFAERNLHLFDRILEDGALRARIHHIIVREWHISELAQIQTQDNSPWTDGEYLSAGFEMNEESLASTKTQIRALAQCMRTLELSSFTWAAIPSIAPVICAALRDRPRCEIEITTNTYSMQTAIWAYNPIANQPTLNELYTLSGIVKLDLILAATDKDLLSLLGRCVTSKSRLRTLKLTAVGRLWPGSTINVQRETERRMSLKQRLHLVRSMSWLLGPVRHFHRRLCLDALELTNFCVCGDADFQLGEIVELRRLRSVQFSCFEMLSPYSSGLVDLTRLALRFRNTRMPDPSCCVTDWSALSVGAFISKCPNLHALELVDRPDVLLEVLNICKMPGLRILKVHSTLSLSSAQDKGNLADVLGSVESYPDRHLEKLAENCPGLQELSISVPSPWHEFYSALELISSSFIHLKSLILFRSCEPYELPSGEKDWKAFTKGNVEDLWNKLQQMTMSRLQQLELHLQHLVSPSNFEYKDSLRCSHNGGERSYTVTTGLDPATGTTKPNLAMDQLSETLRAMRQGAPGPVRGFWVEREKQLREIDDLGMRLHVEKINGKLYLCRR